MSLSEPKATLSLLLNGTEWIALSIPVSQAKEYSKKPLKWLQFLGFAIVGQEGYLSASSTGPAIDYDEDIVARSYYFIFHGEPRLIDVDSTNNKTPVTTTSSISSEHENFRQRLIDRDGTCVVTNEGNKELYQASHIIPHAKGNHYIQNLLCHRGGLYNLSEELNDINDTRNGLLLAIHLHKLFEVMKAAFLKTPNYALDVNDIPHAPGRRDTSENPTTRLTLHYFPGVKPSPIISGTAPPNSDVRIPQDTSEWPLDMLFDASYAAAALHAWGPKDFLDYLKKETRDIYYPGLNVPSSSGQPPGAGQDVLAAQTAARTACLDKRNAQKGQGGQETYDTLDMVYALWTRSAREYSRQHMQEIRAAESARSKGKVEEWLQSVQQTV